MSGFWWQFFPELVTQESRNFLIYSELGSANRTLKAKEQLSYFKVCSSSSLVHILKKNKNLKKKRHQIALFSLRYADEMTSCHLRS